MSSYRVPLTNPTDSKGEAFRKYLEKGGVLSVISKALIEMYGKEGDAVPKDPLQYFRQHIGSVAPSAQELESLKNEVSDLSVQLEKLRKEKAELEQVNEDLKKKLLEVQGLESRNN